MQIPPDFFLDPIGFISFYWTALFPYFIFAGEMLVIFILYLVIVRLARRSLKVIGMGPQAASGITIILRLLFFVSALMVSVAYLNPEFAALFSLTTLFGTAIGLAFSQALSNIVSGLYVFVARPFHVGDYVKIGEIEGIVTEISLNYTRILRPDETKQLVPNSKVVGSQVTNYRIDIDEFIEEQQSPDDEIDTYLERIDNKWEQLKKLASEDEAYRYTFNLTFHMNINHLELRQSFESVLDKWASIFVNRPTYMLWNKPNAAVTYRFVFIVQDPMVIIRRKSEFMHDLMSLYWNR